MNLESKQMERVQRIIALKRYEQPPPGYFHLLPSRIISRIEKGEGKSRVWESWFSVLGTRPVWACAFGLSVCGAVTLGMFYPPQSDSASAASAPLPNNAFWAMATPTTDEAPAEAGTSRGLHVATWLGSTSPVTAPQATASLFDSQEALSVPVSYFREN